MEIRNDDFHLTNEEKAEILTQALPYIKKYNDKIVVVKYGGNAMINEEIKKSVMTDIVLLNLVGIKVVLVHGGGPEISDMLKKMGKESKFIGGLRYTDKETAEVVQMVLGGKINKSLVSLINCQGGKAVGLCGVDGKMIVAKKHVGEVDLGFVGDVVKINTDPILTALNNHYIPVVASIGYDKEGQVYNINADTVASKLAIALKAENVILMTDVPGLLADVNDKNSLITNVKLNEVDALIEKGIISGGMIPKTECCVSAVAEGVKKAVMIDGRVLHAILIEVLSNKGIGTLFTKE